INTLEGGYNISSIMNALDGIAGGLNSVASAANKAANAIAAVGAAQAGTGSGGSGFRSSLSSSNNYSLVDMNTGRVVESGLSKEAAEEKQRKNTGRMYEVKRMAKGGIVTKDKNNPLNSMAEAVGEDTLIAAKEGEGVLTKKQTEALIKLAESVGGGLDENGDIVFSWGKEGKPGLIKNNSDLPIQHTAIEAINPGALDQSLWNLGSLARQPEIAKANAMNNNVNVHYDNMINIQGDVNDANRIVKQIEGVATGIVDKAIKKSWKDANMTLKYGIY
ncbi:MAG: hypothetical protein K2O16_12435, partial [Lachnospiraceae bacterium]|nr:hypothetical protein [Lachnospiraceae bacterium]